MWTLLITYILDIRIISIIIIIIIISSSSSSSSSAGPSGRAV